MSEEPKEYAVTVIDPAAVMPVMRLDAALDRRRQMVEFVKQIMVKDTDFGAIPGTGNKPTLLKPGAEKLTTFFGLTKRFGIIEKVEDWDKPFFYYLYRCSLYRGDMLIAEADGSCNSHESKYRYRQGERLCPKCDQPAIRKSKPPKTGWYCWSKIGGCGEQFRAGDPAVENQAVGRVENKDAADQTNTIQKMAQKRALVAATLLAVNASEFFTQDLEDEQDANNADEQERAAWPPDESTHGNPAPEPRVTATNAGAVTSPSSRKELLSYVNQRVAVKYENASIEGALAHLFNAIRKELGPEWNWPGSKDEAGWQRAAEAAIKHAQDKAPALERADVVKRLETLVTEYQAIGQGLNWDPAWLREAPVEDLIEQGKAKRAQLDALKAKQPAMPGMEGQA